MDEFIRSYFDKGCESFDAYTNTSFTNDKERRCWQKLYSEVFDGEGKEVLNVGCGPGTEALVLADMGFRVTGLDFSSNMVETARYNSEKYGVKYDVIQGDAMDLPFDDNSFDFIASNYALWAIPDPEKAIKEWLRVLRPGGKVAYVEGVWDLKNLSFFRRIWVKIAVRMRKKDGNGHTYDLTDDEKEHLANLWSKKADRPNVQEPTKSEYFQGILKAGYIFGAVEKAENYMRWLLDIRDMIDDKTSKIKEEDKPTVLMTNYTSSFLQTGNAATTWSVYTSIDPMGQACLLAGGHMVAKDILTEEQYSGGPARTLYGAKVGMETIVTADIDYAFGHCVKYTFGGADMGKPAHGYAVNDSAEMVEAYNTARKNVDDYASLDIEHINIIAGDFRNGASGCMLLALYMAKILHPDLFEDLDVLSYHQAYVEEWMGISGFDITKNGVFISPALSA